MPDLSHPGVRRHPRSNLEGILAAVFLRLPTQQQIERSPEAAGIHHSKFPSSSSSESLPVPLLHTILMAMITAECHQGG